MTPNPASIVLGAALGVVVLAGAMVWFARPVPRDAAIIEALIAAPLAAVAEIADRPTDSVLAALSSRFPQATAHISIAEITKGDRARSSAVLAEIFAPQEIE